MTLKDIDFSVAMYGTTPIIQSNYDVAYTGDESSINLRFAVTDEPELDGATAIVHLKFADSSHIERSLELTESVFSYTLKGTENKHAGVVRADIIITKGGAKFTRAGHKFKIDTSLDASVPLIEYAVDTLDTLVDGAEEWLLQTQIDFGIAQSQRADEWVADNDARADEFAESQTDRTSAFNASEASRTIDFNASETGRSNTFTVNENAREAAAESGEAARGESFELSEYERATTFGESEAVRVITFNGSEADRTIAFNLTEAARSEGYTEDHDRAGTDHARAENDHDIALTDQENYDTLLTNLQETINDANENIAEFDVALQNGIVATNISAKLQNLEETYAPNIVSLTSQLAETNAGLSSIEHGNSEEVLNNLNYLGNHQNIHPKVLHFSTPWNGYKYWMAYTPYPSGDTSAENPCIAVSNDMLNWTVPTGLVNPLDTAPASGYNSDTHLLYRSDTGVMEIWWRQYNGSDGSRVIYRRTSTDGVTWTAKETIFTLTAATEILSPVVMFEEGKYKVWGVRGSSVIYQESAGDSISGWLAVRDLNIEWESQNLRPWHLDIIHTDLGYEMIVCAYDVDTGSNNDADLFYVLQKGESFTIPEMVLKRSVNPTANANKSIYRASFIKVNDVYYVFYSFVNLDSTRGMSLSIGRNMLGLNGFRNFKRTIPRAGERTVTIRSNTPLTDYNVTGVDALLIHSTAGEVTINSFVGGYVGQELKVILNSSVAKARFKPSNRLLLPSQNEFLAEDTNQQVVNLVCTNDNLTLNAWRVEVNLPVKKSHTLTAGATATGLNVMNIDAIWIAGAGVTIESLVGGYAGKVVHIYCSTGSASATLVESANLRLPGGTNLVLTAARMGVTAICRNPASNEWRVF